MSTKNNRTCCICRKIYSYCPVCNSEDYNKHDVYPIDMYTTLDMDTGEDKLIMLFSREESRPLYLLWKNHELK